MNLVFQVRTLVGQLKMVNSKIPIKTSWDYQDILWSKANLDFDPTLSKTKNKTAIYHLGLPRIHKDGKLERFNGFLVLAHSYRH